jgi:hypothetical protein
MTIDTLTTQIQELQHTLSRVLSQQHTRDSLHASHVSKLNSQVRPYLDVVQCLRKIVTCICLCLSFVCTSMTYFDHHLCTYHALRWLQLKDTLREYYERANQIADQILQEDTSISHVDAESTFVHGPTTTQAVRSFTPSHPPVRSQISQNTARNTNTMSRNTNDDSLTAWLGSFVDKTRASATPQSFRANVHTVPTQRSPALAPSMSENLHFKLNMIVIVMFQY